MAITEIPGPYKDLVPQLQKFRVEVLAEIAGAGGGVLNFPETHEWFEVDGAVIHRLGDRLFVGAGVQNTAGTRDWLEALRMETGGTFSGVVNTSGTTVTYVSGNTFHTATTLYTTASGTDPLAGQTITIDGVPYTIASVTSTTQLELTTSAGVQTGVAYYLGQGVIQSGSTAQVCILADPFQPAAQNALLTGSSTWSYTPGMGSNGQVYGACSMFVNNNPFEAEAVGWAWYGESHRLNSVVGWAVGMEIETVNRGNTVFTDPFDSFDSQQVQTLQLGSGGGLNSLGQTNSTTALAIFNNGSYFNAGILFTDDAIAAAGPEGSIPAIQMGPMQEIQGYSSAGTLGMRIYLDTANKVTIKSSNTIGLFTAGVERATVQNLGLQVWEHLAVGDDAHLADISTRFPNGRALISVAETFTDSNLISPSNYINKLAGVTSWYEMDAADDAGPQLETYGGRFIVSIKDTSTVNYRDVIGSSGLAGHDGSGSTRFIFGGNFEAQTGFAGTVTSSMIGVHGKIRTLATASGAINDAIGTWSEISLNGSNHFDNLRNFVSNLTVGGTTTVGTLAIIQAGTPTISSTATVPVIDTLYGLRIPDLSQFGTKVTTHFNGISFGANSRWLFEGTNYVGHQVFGGFLTTDVAPTLGSMRGQSAWPEATTNTGGGDFILAGGIGRRFFTALDNLSGTVTLTITVNGTAYFIASGSDFNLGTDNTSPQLIVTATNVAEEINTRTTLKDHVFAYTDGVVVYIVDKGITYSLTIATNQSGRISATSGSDGGPRILLSSCPIYANNAAAVSGGLAVGRFYRTNADPDFICVVH